MQALNSPIEELSRNHNLSIGPTTSRDEMNLAEFPLAVLSTRVNQNLKTLEFKDFQRSKNGELIERKWLITGADKFGLPTATDDDVVLGLINLTMEHGFRDRKVYFSRYELLKILRWSTEGRSYTRLTKSLDRLSGVRIRAANAFYDNKSKAYQTRNFGIIDAYELNDERGSGQQKKSFFIWSEVLFDSFRVGFIKKLDLDLYFSLKSAVSRRLYRYLDKHFYFRSTVERELMTLAFEKLGISRNYKYVSSVKQQLKPALEELVRIGFLSGYEFTVRGKDTYARFMANRELASPALPEPQLKPRSAKIQQSFQAFDKAAAGEGEKGYQQSISLKAPLQTGKQQQLANQLLDRGIHPRQLDTLLQDKSAKQLDFISGIISYYDFLVEKGDQKVSRNKVGFLYRAIQTSETFCLPTDFHPQVEKPPGKSKPDKQKQALEAKQNRDYQQFVQMEVDTYRASLDPTKLAEISKKLEQQMSCLQSVLGEESYQKALEGCLREELARQLKLPDYLSWCNKFLAS